MTFRAKPVVKRVHRTPHDSDHRRTLLLNLMFGLIVLVALLILAGAGFASYYGDHLASIASVNGQGISKDDLRDRFLVDSFRLDYAETRVLSRQDAGRISEAAAQAQIQEISTKRQTVDSDAAENLIDANLLTQLAGPLGVTVSDQQIEAQLVKEATTSEARHVWVIAVRPVLKEGEFTATDAEKAEAKATAEKVLADLRSGQRWEDVAALHTDSVYSSNGGEVGWITATDSPFDKPFLDALFALQANGLTDVIESSDGEFQIGRVTEIDAQAVDQAFQQKIKDAGVSMDAYRRAARVDALKQAIDEKFVTDNVLHATPQRHVAVIFLALPDASQGVGDEVKVRHILFSPKDDPQAAQALAATDPAWKAAEDEAAAEYHLLLKDPSRFADEARAKSDDTGTAPDGGELEYYTRVNLDRAFGDAVFADGLTKDQLLPPVKSAFGWHVIQYIDRRRQPADRMADINALASQAGADFAALAKQYSEDPTTKDNGGDAGWVAKYQLDSATEIAIYKAPVGGLTETITQKAGIYLYKILAEETRMPDADQAEQIRANAYNNWYTAQKNAARIVRDYLVNSGSNPVVQ